MASGDAADPGRYGLSSAWMASGVATITVVAEPISMAWERAGSALSAKNSMYANTTAR